MLAAARQRAVVIADRWLIPHWRHAYKFFSLQSAAVQAAVLLTWGTMPDDMKQSLPTWLLPTLAMFVLGVGVVGRMTKQPTVPGGDQ